MEDQDHARPEENYHPTFRKFVLNLVTGQGKKGRVAPISVTRLIKFEGAPSERTIRNWKKQKTDEQVLEKNLIHRGPVPALSEIEKLVLGGWALNKVHSGKMVTIRVVKMFLKVNV